MATTNETTIKPTTPAATEPKLTTGGPNVDSSNQWGFGSPTYDAKTGQYSTPGIVWNGSGPAPTGQAATDGISALFNGSWLEGTAVQARPDGSYVAVGNGAQSPLSNIGGSTQPATPASTPTISQLNSQQSGSQPSPGGAPAASGAPAPTAPASGSNPFAGWAQSDLEALQKMAAAGLNPTQVGAMKGLNEGNPSAFYALTNAQQQQIKQFAQANMSADQFTAWWPTGGAGSEGATTTGPNGGVSTTPGGQTNVGDANANLNFTDQGDGVYRGWKSGGPTNAVNTTQADGSVQGNYQDTRGNEFRAAAVTADSMGKMSVEDAAAAAAAQNNRTVGQNELASKQLNDILAQDSPLMQLARQDGINTANSRGLTNSSLAAGASMAEMTRQASPLAQQQAEAYRQAEAQNQQLESSRLEQNAGREQQASMFNAEQQNAATGQEFGTEADMRKFNAQTQTSTNVANAGMANDMLNADRQRSYGYALQQLAGDQDYAKQTMASQTAVDIANIEGQYKQLISENDTAARMFDSTYQAIAAILSNKDIYASEASSKINYLTQTMETMMNSLLAYQNFDFAPSTATGNGKNSSFG